MNVFQVFTLIIHDFKTQNSFDGILMTVISL